MRLRGHKALVTGAGGGIGRAIAAAFAAEGAAVACLDIDRHGAQGAVDAARARTPEACLAAIAADVSDPASNRDAVAGAVAALGGITVLVNNAAAVTARADVTTLPLEDWERALAVNLTGAMLACRYAIPEIEAAGGVRVNSLSPGPVLTSRLSDRHGSAERARDALTPHIPLARLGCAEEVAAAAVFLASPDSAYMTGADLRVDRGFAA